MSSILCTICARAGSKGVENKNIRLLDGKPLIAYTIEQAKESKLFEHIVISTDSDEIAEISKKYGAEVFFKRDERMASDNAGKLEVIKDAFIKSELHYNKRYDYQIDLDVTSPLRSVSDIINSFNLLVEKKYDNLITAMPSRRNPYFNLVELTKDNRVVVSKKLDETIIRRQDAPDCFDMNASIYIWTRETILNKNEVFLPNTGLYVMPEERSIDIDTEFDFKIVEFLKKEEKC